MTERERLQERNLESVKSAQGSALVSYATYAAAVLVLLSIGISLWLAVGSPAIAMRSQCRNNLTRIGLALHQYHTDYECFPPAFVSDGQGRPMHSWRVLLLPYLDQAPLYAEYRFDEPWDGPNNRKLADRVVSIYSCPVEKAEKGSPESFFTNYVAVVGPGTAWPGPSSIRVLDVKDEPASSVHLVEAAHSGIHWMEPRDLHVLQMNPTVNASSGQGISSRHPGGAHVLTTDGVVHFAPDTIPEKQLRHALEINDGVPLRDEF